MANFGWHSTTDDVLEGIDLKGKRALHIHEYNRAKQAKPTYYFQ